jgi:hypothetical protein
VAGLLRGGPPPGQTSAAQTTKGAAQMPPKAKKDEAPEISPADAAIAEATDQPIVVKWRKAEFSIPQSVFASPHVQFGAAAGSVRDWLFHTLKVADPTYPALFLEQCVEGDDFSEVALEFTEKFSAAAGMGNS